LAGGEFGLDYYLDLITDFDPSKKVIVRADGNKNKLNSANIGKQEIDVDGILVYEYTCHNEDFIVTRVSNINEVMDIMFGSCGLKNMFSGDILIIENGKRKKYRVKDEYGNIVTCENIDKIRNSKLDIEWIP